MRPLLLLVLAAATAAGAGCLEAHPPDGAFACSPAGACPAGYQCAADRTCWAAGHLGDGGLGSPIRPVGQATTRAANNLGTHPTAAMPSGAGAGDLLVVTAAVYADSSSIDCADVTWTKAFDQVGGSVRLAACVKIAAADEPAPGVLLGSEGEFALVAMAFRGVDAAQPIDAALAASGPTSPLPATHAMAPLYVLAEGSIGFQSVAAAPANAALGASVNDGNNVQAALASAPASTPGGFTWRVPPSLTAVAAGTIALRPRR